MIHRILKLAVSTHSRLKAAGVLLHGGGKVRRRFNTQPPKGGWSAVLKSPFLNRLRFNTQPPKGGWRGYKFDRACLAGFNTQPPKGGWEVIGQDRVRFGVSTHSRLKAAGLRSIASASAAACFNTQPPKGGWLMLSEDGDLYD